MNTKLMSVACVALGLGLSACGSYDDTAGESEPAEIAEMNLNVNVKGDTDVAGFIFKAQRTKKQDCYGYPVTEDPYYAKEGLTNQTLPGDVDTIADEDKKYADGEHRFADHLFRVKPGCYKLTAKPIDKYGDPSKDCAVASLDHQNVEANGYTFEAHLISQCRGKARAMLDIIASINRPPKAEIDVEKFACEGGGVHACVTASDPDGDPVKISFPTLYESYEGEYVGEQTVDPYTGKTKRCARIPADKWNEHDDKILVQDLGWTPEYGGKLVPIEHFLAQQYNDGSEVYGDDFNPDYSRDVIKFPVHIIPKDQCIPGAMAFIGTTIGAKLEYDSYYKLKTDPYWGMTEEQGEKLSKNAVKHVNPGNDNPHILVVLDDNNQNEDRKDGKYIKQLLEKDPSDPYKDLTFVDYIDEPTDGLKKHHVLGYDIVWLVNPGFPIDDQKTLLTLKHFRERGGGVVLSGDDASQASFGGSYPISAKYFSFLKYKGDNGTMACGETTNNNQSLEGRYLVKFQSPSPLTKGFDYLADHPVTYSPWSFPYGNDIDKTKLADPDGTVGAITKGLKSDPYCLIDDYGYGARDVMTTVPTGEIFDGM